MTENKKLKVTFAPGCFDSFDGTQEELDQMIAEIEAAIESGELLEQSQELTDEDFDELPDDVKQQLLDTLNEEFGNTTKRNLQ